VWYFVLVESSQGDCVGSRVCLKNRPPTDHEIEWRHRLIKAQSSMNRHQAQVREGNYIQLRADSYGKVTFHCRRHVRFQPGILIHFLSDRPYGLRILHREVLEEVTPFSNLKIQYPRDITVLESTRSSGFLVATVFVST
jgi:hypothetical protein